LQAIANIPDEMRGKMSNDIKIADIKLQALKLVLGRPQAAGPEAAGPGAPPSAAAGAAAGQEAAVAPAPPAAPVEEKLYHHGQQEALKKFIAGFMQIGATAAAKGDARARLGQAPPCREYRSLVCLCDFEGMIEKILMAESQQDITNAVANMVPWKAAIQDILSSSKAWERRVSSKNATADKSKQTTKWLQRALL